MPKPVYKAAKVPAVQKGTNFALIFGLERYVETKLDKVAYAQRDAEEIKSALLQLGYDEDNVILVLNSEATKTTIEYETRQIAGSAGKDDTILFFFAGHGATYDGDNYLLAHDTKRGDVKGTAVKLKEVFRILDESSCPRLMFFLDCCHSGANLVDDDARGYLDHLSEDEIGEFLEGSEYRVVFASCSKDQSSYPSTLFQHGFWTYHLLRALRGEEPKVLDAGGRLLSHDLQNYLVHEVPKQVNLQTVGAKRRQNPKMWGPSSGTFMLADLSDLLERRRIEKQASSLGGKFKNAEFSKSKTGRIADLIGFKAGRFTVPKEISAYTEGLVTRWSKEDLENEKQKFFKRIRSSKKYSNSEIKCAGPDDGGMTIKTPDFELTVSISQHSDNCRDYVIDYNLSGLYNPDLLQEDWFNNAFDGVFDSLFFEWEEEIDVDDLINKLEDAGYDVECDADRTWAQISPEGFDGSVVFQEGNFYFDFYKARTPLQMNEHLQIAQKAMMRLPSSVGNLLKLD